MKQRKQRLAIKVGGSERFARLIYDYVTSFGYGKFINPDSPEASAIANADKNIFFFDELDACYGITENSPGYKYIDARTQMKELIAMLEGEVKQIKLNDSYTAEVSADKKTVKVACQTFTREAITELYQALQ